MPRAEEPIHLSRILEPYKGKWVTLTKDEKTILGFGDTIDIALEKAKEKGEFFPLLVKVPDSTTAALFH